MTTVTLTSRDSRHSRAILLAADSGQWLRPDRLIAGRRAVGIPSQRVRGLYHWTDGQTCSCADFARYITTVELAQPRAPVLVPRRLRCINCGGQPIAGERITETSYTPMPRVVPRRGRPPKWLRELRRSA